MKKLRLLVTRNCGRNCEGCCNKDWELEKLPIANPFDYCKYEEVIVTGGEPLFYPDRIKDVDDWLQDTDSKSQQTKVFVYTSFTQNIPRFFRILPYVNGVTVTLHTQEDVLPFAKLTEALVEGKYFGYSFRVNIFRGVQLPSADFKLWEIKSGIEWIKNCPLPQGEVFMQTLQAWAESKQGVIWHREHS